MTKREYLIKLRVDKGLTQQESADYMGISRTAYINIESGKQKELKISALSSLAELLKVEPKIIILEEQKRIRPDF